jgi:uncharacterized RDD family membrane protein YckC
MLPTGLVTPEGVVLDLETASVGTRTVGMVLDLLLIGVGLVVLGLALAGVNAAVDLPGWVSAVIGIFAVFALLFVYPCAFETFWRGRTPGKAAMGLRVVTVEGAPIRFRHAAIRAMLGLIDFWVPPGGATAILTILCSKRDQRLGDHVAGTLVLRERQPRLVPEGAVWFTVPRGWESYASGIDTAALTPVQYQLVRNYLLRAESLSPAARYSLGGQLTSSVGTRLSALPSPGVPADLYLTCVVAMYQRRGLPPLPASV